MHPDGYRPARDSEFPSLSKRRKRWGVGALLVLGALAAGAIPAAQAATGGAAPTAPTASASDGEGLAFTPLRVAGASWYGPGLYGRRTACGERLGPNTLGVAHKRLPCGTVVKFVFRGRTLITRVIDRGPYVRGRAWDLTAAASEALGFKGVGVGRVRYAVAREYARAKR